jgi:hypothetical protein
MKKNFIFAITAIFTGLFLLSPANSAEVSNKAFKLSTISTKKGSCNILLNTDGEPVTRYNSGKKTYSTFGVGSGCPSVYPKDKTIKILKVQSIAMDGSYMVKVTSPKENMYIRPGSFGNYTFRKLK